MLIVLVATCTCVRGEADFPEKAEGLKSEGGRGRALGEYWKGRQFWRRTTPILALPLYSMHGPVQQGQ